MDIKSDLFEGGRKLPVVEEFYSIQGEGYHTGKPAYFLRIGGCDVGCHWCDTKFSWNPKVHPVVETDKIVKNILHCPANALVVTGGEPLLFDLGYLCSEVKQRNIETYLETSGAHELSGKWDWLCLSPKKQLPPITDIYEKADELKVIIETRYDLLWAVENSGLVKDSCILLLQPEWSVYDQILPVIIDFVLENPSWNISIQAHKFMRIP